MTDIGTEVASLTGGDILITNTCKTLGEPCTESPLPTDNCCDNNRCVSTYINGAATNYRCRSLGPIIFSPQPPPTTTTTAPDYQFSLVTLSGCNEPVCTCDGFSSFNTKFPSSSVQDCCKSRVCSITFTQSTTKNFGVSLRLGGRCVEPTSVCQGFQCLRIDDTLDITRLFGG